MDDKVRIKISPRVLDGVRTMLRDGHKIKAIKAVRSEGKAFPGEEIEKPDENGKLIKALSHRVGLRNAKDAVEVLAGQKTQRESSAFFAPAVRIKKVIIEGENGDIEMDLDELQLRLLDGLGIVPMSEIAAMTELMQFLREWGGE